MIPAGTTQVEAATITDAAAIAGSSTSTQFVSNWQLDSNSTSHTVIFEHGLGTIPTSLLVLFSVDLATAYPVLWPWSSGESGNPVSIWMDAKTISLAITAGPPLHGWWNAISSWTSANSGFWRVIASI